MHRAGQHLTSSVPAAQRPGTQEREWAESNLAIFCNTLSTRARLSSRCRVRSRRRRESAPRVPVRVCARARAHLLPAPAACAAHPPPQLLLCVRPTACLLPGPSFGPRSHASPSSTPTTWHVCSSSQQLQQQHACAHDAIGLHAAQARTHAYRAATAGKCRQVQRAKQP